MKVERSRTTRSFSAGIIGFALAFLVLVWAKLEHKSTKALCTSLWAIGGIALAATTRSSANMFSVSAESPIVGQGVVTGSEFIRKAGAASAQSASAISAATAQSSQSPKQGRIAVRKNAGPGGSGSTA